MPAEIMKPQLQQVAGDCAIASLATYIGVPYAEVMRVAGSELRSGGRDGLWPAEAIRIAAVFGETLKRRRKPDLDEHYGLLVTPDHCAVIRNGLVFDGNGSVWEWEAYFASEHITVNDVLVLSAD